MNLRRSHTSRNNTCLPPAARRRAAAFTLAEVLAAMLFMAIVAPVAIMGLRLASQAGEVASRKAIATRVAERVLNELAIARPARGAVTDGLIRDGHRDYRYQLTLEPSGFDILNLATVQVFYTVQGREHDVRLSTLLHPQ